MTTTTLPAPTVTTPFSYGSDYGKSRHIDYYLTPEPVEPGDKAQAVQVSIYHDSSRKVFRATGHHVTHEKGAVFSSTSYELMAGVTLMTEPVSRFSQKALDAFTEKVVASVPALVEVSEKFAAMFETTEEG